MKQLLPQFGRRQSQQHQKQQCHATSNQTFTRRVVDNRNDWLEQYCGEA